MQKSEEQCQNFCICLLFSTILYLTKTVCLILYILFFTNKILFLYINLFCGVVMGHHSLHIIRGHASALYVRLPYWVTHTFSHSFPDFHHITDVLRGWRPIRNVSSREK